MCKGYIVFFSFIDVQKKKFLNFLQVCEIFRFCFGKFKEAEVTRKVHEVFLKVNANRGTIKQTVTLKEFQMILY